MCAVIVSTDALKNELCYMSSVLVISLRDTKIGGLPNFISNTERALFLLHLVALQLETTEGSRVYKVGYEVDPYFVNSYRLDFFHFVSETRLE